MSEKKIFYYGVPEEVLRLIPEEFVVELLTGPASKSSETVCLMNGPVRRHLGLITMRHIILETPEWFQANQTCIAVRDQCITDIADLPEAYERSFLFDRVFEYYQLIKDSVQTLRKELLTEAKVAQLLEDRIHPHRYNEFVSNPLSLRMLYERCVQFKK